MTVARQEPTARREREKERERARYRKNKRPIASEKSTAKRTDIKRDRRAGVTTASRGETSIAGC